MSAPVRAIACVLEPGFALRALAALADALQVLNASQSEFHYQLGLLSVSGAAVASESGPALLCQPLDATTSWRTVVVIAGPQRSVDARLLAQLRDWDRQGVLLGGIGTGAATLAAAGLLDGQRACADWRWLDPFAAAYPAVAWSQGLWDLALPQRRFSAATAGVSDLISAWVAQWHGLPAQQALERTLDLRQARRQDERQRREQDERQAHSPPKLAEALALMEANLAEPLPTEEVARLVGVSRRQLERLFKQHLDSLPSRHYLSLRLERAQRLLQQGTQSILQVGLSCGFASGPHFSNAYKAYHGHTPREERSRRPGWPGAPLGDPA
ncbi:helix-turn-helix domain-containing protein [Paucibacter sp. APW11]|uniref:Helix-turn-helix domain-containing protein n=1 Tax=Roseateles aquae TaxID=3077235 RepID=A0ABU3PFL9_9BURK|nr:helix-turn-helix domain-containing protein [Paucibacter sp. APW11]MDT9000967.1 helix-turn-helix domain-containing protein [Paucibacter sp. APW11]